MCLQCAVSKTWLHGVVTWNFGDCCSVLGNCDCCYSANNAHDIQNTLEKLFSSSCERFYSAKPSI